jgi:hypothetical protein
LELVEEMVGLVLILAQLISGVELLVILAESFFLRPL